MSESSPKPKRRRFLKFVIVLLILVGVGAVFGPTLLAPVARRFAVSQMDKNLNAKAGIGDLSFSLAGDVDVADVSLTDLDGQSIVNIDSIAVDADLKGALRGKLGADVVIDGLVVHLRQRKDGSWNVTNLAKEPAKPSQGGSSEPPDVKATVELKNSRVIIHGAGGDTELSDLRFALQMAGKDSPMTFDAGLKLIGPSGPAGALNMDGRMALTAAGPGEGEVKIAITDLLLKALEPVVTAVAPIRGLNGTLAGSMKMELGKTPLDVKGGGEFVLSALRVQPTRDGAPDLVVDRSTFKVDMQPAEGGAGRQQIGMKIGDLIAIDYDGQLQMQGEAQRVAGKVTVDGAIARLVDAARSFAPIQSGAAFGGRLSGTTSFDMAMGSDGPGAGSIGVDMKVLDLTATDGTGRALDLRDLRTIAFALDGKNDVAADRFSMSKLRVDAGPIQVDGRVEVSGLKAAQAGGQPKIDDSTFNLSADLARVATLLSSVLEGPPPDLGGTLAVTASAKQDGDRIAMTTEIAPRALRVAGIGVAGEPLRGSFSVLAKDGAMAMSGGLTTQQLAVTLPDGKSVQQRDVKIDLDVARDVSERMEIKRVSYRSPTAELNVSGAMTGSDPASANGDFKIGLKAQVERLLADLGSLASLDGYRGKGAVDAAFDVSMRPERMQFGGGLTATGVDLTIPPPEPGDPEIRLQEPNVRLDLASSLVVKSETMDLEKFALESKTMWGSMAGKFTGLKLDAPEGTPMEMYVESLKGRFEYIPDRLGALLAPVLPGRLIGATAEELKIDFKGPLADMDVFAMLSQSNLSVGLGLGTFSTLLLDTTGRIDMEIEGGRLHMLGDLGANGGTLDLNMGLGVSSQSSDVVRRSAELSVKLADVKAGAALAGLLGKVHPVFGSLGGGGSGGDLLAMLTGELDLKYNGPTSVQELVKGWNSLPKDLFYGKGLIRIDQPVIKGSPLLDTLFNQLGVPAEQGLVIEPVAFEIDSSRLKYADAWKWVLGDVKTNFDGSVGLDGGLALNWNVPINKRLVGRYQFLEPLVGQDLRIPLGGTMGAPKLAWTEAVQSLAGDAAKKAIQDQIGAKLPGEITSKLPGELGDILGQGKDDPNAPKEDPKDLLSKANALWDAGDKAGAQVHYATLRDRHKLTTVYLLNRDQIDKRADWKPKKGGEEPASAGAVDPAAAESGQVPPVAEAGQTPPEVGAGSAGDATTNDPTKKDAGKDGKSDKGKDDDKSDKEKYKEKSKKDKDKKDKKGGKDD